MSDIGTALRAKLQATAGVTGLLSTRVYPDQLEQGCDMPAAVYFVVSGNEEGSLDGLVGLTHSRIQVDAYATTRAGANALAAAIRTALASQANSRGTWGTVAVSGCSVAGGERYDTQAKGDGSDDPYYITMRDFLVSFQDS
jgi:porphobilinogen deaminase